MTNTTLPNPQRMAAQRAQVQAAQQQAQQQTQQAQGQAQQQSAVSSPAAPGSVSPAAPATAPMSSSTAQANPNTIPPALQNGGRRRSTLGKGLGALLGEAAEDYKQLDQALAAKDAAKENAKGGMALPKSQIPVELLAPSPFQPRKYFDPAALADLAQSIREKGIIQPLVVRRNPTQPHMYEIIAGERRWRAAQQAGLHDVPVVLRDYTDAQAMEVAIIENVQRQDLNPIEEAEGYARLSKEYGHTQEEIARLVGKSRPHIANTMRLLQLPDEAQKMLRDGGLTAGHARALLAATKDPEFMSKLLAGDSFKGSVRDAEQAMREIRAEQGLPDPRKEAKHQGVKLRDPNIMMLEQTIAQTMGLKVAIMEDKKRGSQSGSLMIKYQNLDQLDDILKKLCGQAIRV